MIKIATPNDTRVLSELAIQMTEFQVVKNQSIYNGEKSLT